MNGEHRAKLEKLERTAGDATDKMRDAVRALSRAEPRKNETMSEFSVRWRKLHERQERAERAFVEAEKALWIAQDEAGLPRTRGG